MTKMYTNKINIAEEEYNLVCINYKDEPKEDKNISVPNMHHIHVLDRSGSMWGSIDKLIDNVIETLDYIQDNDLISVIFFSSEDNCRVLFKGISINNKDLIIQKLNTMRSCSGCTCFSEPLKSVTEIIEDLKIINPNFNICFFTDGCIVTPWSDEEEKERMRKSLTIIKENNVLALNTIGYGNYYDEELLKEMSTYSSFGRFNHSRDIDNYKDIFSHEYSIIKDIIPDPVLVKSDNSKILYLTTKNSKLNENELNLTFLNRTKNQFFILTKSNKFSINDEEFNISDIKNKIPKPSLTNFIYAYAKESYYKGNQHEAIDILLNIGDKLLIDSIMNSFTKDERAVTMELLTKASNNNKERLKEGTVDSSYVPSPNAFNVIDFLSELTNVKCQYIPVSSSEYKKVSKTVIDEYDLFVKDKTKEVIADMNELVFNEKRLNVSIRYLIPGTVKLNPRQAKSVELKPSYDVYRYGSQTIIKDGTLNVPKIKIRIHYDSINKLSKEAQDFLLKNEYDKENDYFIIDLSTIPIVNRKYSDMDANNILYKTFELLKLKATQKTLKYMIGEVKDYNKNILKENITYITNHGLVFNEEQLDVLRDHGINKDLIYVGVDRKTVDSEIKDSYETRSIEFSIKGCSSIPKITDSIKKKDNGKKLNKMDQVIVNTLSDYEGKDVYFLEEKLKEVKDNISTISKELFASKVSKILTGGFWEKTVPTDKGYIFEDNDNTLIIKTKRETVYL